jgi:hypothetical protein
MGLAGRSSSILPLDSNSQCGKEEGGAGESLVPEVKKDKPPFASIASSPERLPLDEKEDALLL